MSIISQALLEMMRIPNVKQRLETYSFRFQAPQKIDTAKQVAVVNMFVELNSMICVFF